MSETGGAFEWTLFGNSNRTTFVQRLQKVGMFDSDLVRLTRPKIESNKIQNVKFD
jgi:hypothetical protein